MEKRIEEIIRESSEEISILGLLDDDERKRLAPSFEPVCFPAGTVCYREGEIMNFLGIIVSGKLEVKKETELKGRYIFLAILGRGSHIGSFSMLQNRRSYGIVTALEDTEIITISREKLEAFIDKYPRTGNKILKGVAAILSIRLRMAIEKVAHLS